MATEVLPELDLRRYLSGLARRKFVILAVTALAVVTALVISFLQSPLYEAKADIVLHLSNASSVFPGGAAQTQLDPKLLIDTEIKMIESRPVRDIVTRQLGPHSKVSAGRVDETLLIEVRGYGSTPRRAATVANAYARSYIDERQRRAADELGAAGGALQDQIAGLQSQIDDLDARVAAAPATERDGLRSSLATRRDSLVNQQGLFRQSLDELKVESGLKSTEVELVTVASAPESPVRPTPVRNAILALVVGAMFGVGVAAAMEYFDDSVRSADDVTQVTGLPVLGAIPSFQERHARPALVAATSEAEKDARAREAYRSLRTSVQMLGVPRALSTIQFTSAGPSEGKTTTLANLAVAMAATGKKVVVVDADLRRPRLHEVFGVANHTGFTSVVLGDLPLLESLQDAPGHEGLTLLTAGSPPANPSELLSLSRTSEVVFELESRFDLVLIDSAPVLPVTDSIVLSTWVQAVVILAAVGSTRRSHLRKAMQLFEQAQTPVVGAVVVRTTPEARYGYEYYGGPGGAGVRSPSRRHRVSGPEGAAARGPAR